MNLKYSLQITCRIHRRQKRKGTNNLWQENKNKTYNNSKPKNGSETIVNFGSYHYFFVLRYVKFPLWFIPTKLALR